MNISQLRRLFALAVLLLAGAAQAMGTAGCSQPMVFPGAAVNALVLPWRVDAAQAARSPELQAASEQISALAHLQLLWQMLPYGSIGAVNILQESRQPCDVDDVLFIVTRVDMGGGRLATGQAVLALWGRLFEQDGEIYLQTYLRFGRQGAEPGLQDERFRFSVKAPGGGAPLQLSAALPMQALAFAPRRISRAELAQVARDFSEAVQVREQPSLAAPGRPLSTSASGRFPYWVVGQQGEWMQLKPMRAGLPSGWIQARRATANDGEALPAWSLARWMPELEFAQAVAGWLRLQAGGVPAAQVPAIVAAVLAGLQRYEDAVPAERAPTPWGLAAALRGQLALRQGQAAQAATHFETARALLPGNAQARNLAAVVALTQAPLDAERSARFVQQMLATLAVAPDQAQARANLAEVYRLFGTQSAWSPYDAAELDRRRAMLPAAR